jgi:uncharacterized small protein (DUF1192 family)
MKMQEGREQQKMDMQRQAMEAFGGSGPASDGMASGGGAPGMGGESSKLNALRQAAIAGVPGAKELFEIHKYENEPREMKAGSMYENRSNGQKTFMPKVSDGIMLGADGASQIPGYAGANAGIEGAKAGAIEGAKAQYNTTTLNLPEGPRMVSTAQIPQIMGGAGGWDGINKATKAAQPARDKDRLGILMEERAREKDPRNIAMLDREIANAGGARAGGPGIALQSEVERERQIGAVRAETEIDKTARLAKQASQTSAKKLYEQLNAAIPTARTLLKTATGSGIGALADTVGGYFGKSTASSEAAGQLEVLGSWMTSNVPRMEGPQSNSDAKTYATMAALVGDRTVPVKTRLASLDTLEGLQKKYADINGVAGPAKPNAPAAPMAEMPKANASNKGRIIRDSDTGKRYRSNGLQWTEEK